MALGVIAGSSGMTLLFDLGGSLGTDSALVPASTSALAAPGSTPVATAVGLTIHPGGTAFLATATLDHQVLATTGTLGSAIVAGSAAPLGDEFAHAIHDWLMDV